MSETEVSTESWREAGRYEIRLVGLLDQRWAEWFDGSTLTHRSDGTTVLLGPVVDQAALHGLLQKVRDLGLPLISVAQVAPDRTTTHDTTTHDTTIRSTP